MAEVSLLKVRVVIIGTCLGFRATAAANSLAPAGEMELPRRSSMRSSEEHSTRAQRVFEGRKKQEEEAGKELEGLRSRMYDIFKK